VKPVTDGTAGVGRTEGAVDDFDGEQ